MKKHFRKFTVLCLILFATQSTFAPKRSEAVVGAVIALTGGTCIPLIVGGAVFVGGYAVSFLAGNTGVGWIAAGIGLLGLVVLDDHGTPALRLQSLTPDEGHRLGLSAREVEAYNDELDELTIITQTVASELAADPKNANLEASASLWSKYRGDISPEAFSAFVQVSRGLTARASR